MDYGLERMARGSKILIAHPVRRAPGRNNMDARFPAYNKHMAGGLPPQIAAVFAVLVL